VRTPIHHPLRIVAVLVSTVFVIGQAWTAPFRADATGLPSLFAFFSSVLLFPAQILGILGWAAGGSPDRGGFYLGMLLYVAGLCALDAFLTRRARANGPDAA